MHKSIGLLLVASCLWILSPVTARALSLADVAVGGASFASSDGQLTFSNFEVSDLTASGFDPRFLSVVPIDFGFKLVPADDGFGVLDGRIEDPVFHFDVTSTLGIRGVGLDIRNAFGGALARGAGSFVRVEVGWEEPLVAMLLSELTDGQLGSASDQASLSPAKAGLSLWTRVDMISGDGAGSALFPQIEYRFATEVPEPGAASLLLLGLAGAAWMRRRS